MRVVKFDPDWLHLESKGIWMSRGAELLLTELLPAITFRCLQD
jgi:hypothetical protein